MSLPDRGWARARDRTALTLLVVNTAVLSLLLLTPIGTMLVKGHLQRAPSVGAGVALIIVVLVLATFRTAPIAATLSWRQAVFLGVAWGAVAGAAASLPWLLTSWIGAPAPAAAAIAASYGVFLAIGAGAFAGAACAIVDRLLAPLLRSPRPASLRTRL